jgi:hypothetical protein
VGEGRAATFESSDGPTYSQQGIQTIRSLCRAQPIYPNNVSGTLSTQVGLTVPSFQLLIGLLAVEGSLRVVFWRVVGWDFALMRDER